MQTSTIHFQQRIKTALADDALHRALAIAKDKFTNGRAAAVADYNMRADFEALRTQGEAIRNEGIARMPELLTEFEQRAAAHGSVVLWAADAARAREMIISIARQHNARTIAKSKSMVSEEIFLNDALAAAGITPIETDLGEFILQLQDEKPAHIVAPAMHKSRAQVAQLFAKEHIGGDGGGDGNSDDKNINNSDIPTLTRFAREHLRAQFTTADIGLSGANFLVADSGAALIVTNEGNGSMVTSLPPVHITLASIDKIVPRLSDIPTMINLLTRSATGQHITTYVDITAGKNKNGGNPQHHYIVLLDNGRSHLRASRYREMLRCIRCGACMNHCPVFHTIGGQAYGSVYMGPMGQVLTPTLAGLENASELPSAATLCGACQVVCPVKIPLPDLMRQLRQEKIEKRLTPRRDRWLIAAWHYAATHPALYALATRMLARLLAILGGRERRIGNTSFFSRQTTWTHGRDIITTSHGKTFRELWRKQEQQRHD